MHSKQIYLFILVIGLFITSCEKIASDPGKSDEVVKSAEGLNYWGGSGEDEGLAVIQTADGGYAVAGSQYSSTTQYNLTLVKFTSSMAFDSKTNYGGAGGNGGTGVVLLSYLQGGMSLVSNPQTAQCFLFSDREIRKKFPNWGTRGEGQRK